MILIVKSPLAFYIGTFVLSTGLLAGCGQPGPLYLPKPPVSKPVKPAPAAPPNVAPAAIPPPPQLDLSQ